MASAAINVRRRSRVVMLSFFIGKTIIQGSCYYNLEKHPEKSKENDHQQTAVMPIQYKMNQPVFAQSQHLLFRRKMNADSCANRWV
jgi:hypothetical protein